MATAPLWSSTSASSARCIQLSNTTANSLPLRTRTEVAPVHRLQCPSHPLWQLCALVQHHRAANASHLLPPASPPALNLYSLTAQDHQVVRPPRTIRCLHPQKRIITQVFDDPLRTPSPPLETIPSAVIVRIPARQRRNAVWRSLISPLNHELGNPLRHHSFITWPSVARACTSFILIIRHAAGTL